MTSRHWKIPRSDWLRPVGVAATIFLTALATGAVLLVAAKVQFPSLGSGSGPLAVLRAVGLMGLASLGVPIAVDRLELTVIPLGSLSAIAAVALTGCRDMLRHANRPRVVDACGVALGLAVMMGLGAAVFRFGGGTRVSASVSRAGSLGLLWGITFVGAATAYERARRRPRRNDRATSIFVRLVGAAMVATTAALLCIVIARLVSHPLPAGIGVTDALAALLYLVAFLPNILVALFSLALGATIEIGAQIDLAGTAVGPLREISLGALGGVWWLLLTLPVIVPIAATSRRALPTRERWQAVAAGVVAAAAFALTIGVLAASADARLGAGLVRERGVGLVAVDPVGAAFRAFAWTTVVIGVRFALLGETVRRPR